MKLKTHKETRVWKHALYGVSPSSAFKIQTTPQCFVDRIGTRSQANNWVKDWPVDGKVDFCFVLNRDDWRSPNGKCFKLWYSIVRTLRSWIKIWYGLLPVIQHTGYVLPFHAHVRCPCKVNLYYHWWIENWRVTRQKQTRTALAEKRLPTAFH
jgi:hypothetical protein